MPLVNRSFSDIITFTRASGGGRFNAQGQYEWLPANQPRLDYDPVTGEAKGLLIEEQRTNLLTYSSDFANAAWGKTGAVVVGNAYTSPSGLQDACSVRNTPGVNSFVFQQKPLSPSTTYTRSVFAKHVTGASELVFEYTIGGSLSAARFNLVTGTVVNLGSLGSPSATITRRGNGWYRCTHTFTTAASGTNGAGVFYIGNYGATPAETTFALWGAQLEAGAFPTSLIHTEGAQVTRAASDPSLQTLSPWLNQSAGTFIIEHDAVAGRPLLSSGETLLASSGGAGRTVLAYDATGSYVSQNGGAFVAGPPLTFADSLRLMRSATQWANAHCRALRYYPRRLTLAEASA